MPAFIISVVDEDAAPIANAVVGLFTEEGDPIISDTTGEDGRTALIGPDAVVALRVAQVGYVFHKRTFITPVEGATFTVVGVARDVRAPSDPSRCRVYGTIQDPLGQPYRGELPLKVTLLGRISGEPVDVMTSSTASVPLAEGEFGIDLQRGWQYRIGPLPLTEISDEAPNYEFVVFNVPDRAAVNFIDLADPYPTFVSGVDDAVRITQGAGSALFELSVTLSDDSTAQSPAEYLDPASSNEQVVTAKVLGKSLVLTRVSAGEATVSLSTFEGATTRVESTFFSGRAVRVVRTIAVTCE